MQVVLMDNVKPRISVPIKNFKRTISGPVVKDDIFEILKSLVQDAVDAFFQMCFTVVDRCDH